MYYNIMHSFLKEKLKKLKKLSFHTIIVLKKQQYLQNQKTVLSDLYFTAAGTEYTALHFTSFLFTSLIVNGRNMPIRATPPIRAAATLMFT